MEATRGRVEWIAGRAVAVAFVGACVTAGTLAVREFRTLSALMPIVARDAPAAAPAAAGIPSRAISVPMLLLTGGGRLGVGDTLAEVAARLGRQAEIWRQSAYRTPYGDRLIRLYEHAGTRFVLVFEAFEPGGEPKVAAIYLQ